MKLATLKHKLKAHTNGKPQEGPTKDLKDQVCGLGLCDLGSCGTRHAWRKFRGNKHLYLPEWARPLLPTQIR